MAITRIDESELLLPLHEGIDEVPRWRVFLARLLRRSRADHVALIVRRDNAVMRKAHFHAAAVDQNLKETALGDLAKLDPRLLDDLRPGRVYSLAEMAGPQDGTTSAPAHARGPLIGAHGRVLRVSGPDGAGIWVILSRRTRNFSAADGALLGGLAPHFAVALRTVVALDIAELALAISTDALARGGIGWAADAMRSGRATAAKGGASHSSITVAAPRHRTAVLAVPERVVLDRRAPQLGRATAAYLQVHFGLAAKESSLAIALAQGQSLRAAATALGLTIETTRQYSKILYSKTGTRGQVDLTRLIWSSVAPLA